jgi:hypothetical protein
MQCRSCHVRLDYEDNYCRKCGAAVEILDVQVVHSEPAGPVSTLRAAALPVVRSSATVIVAGTLLRFAVRQLIGRGSARGVLPFGRRSLGAGEVEEVFFYRRQRAD